MVSFATTFSHCKGCLLTLLIIFFIVEKKFCLFRFHLFVFVFIPLLFEMGHRRSCYYLCKSILPMFSSLRFIVSGLIFRSLFHFEFIFEYGIRKSSNLILLHTAAQFSQNHLVKRFFFFFIAYFCLFCQRYGACCCCSSVIESYSSLCNPIDCSTPSFPFFHYFLEFAQTHVY